MLIDPIFDEPPTAINASELSEKLQKQVDLLRNVTGRPVYVKPGATKDAVTIPKDLAVGTEEYGEVERKLIARGYSLVVGECNYGDLQ